jgi:hypothetical protein
MTNEQQQILACLKLLIEGSTIASLEKHFGKQTTEIACDMFMEMPNKQL